MAVFTLEAEYNEFLLYLIGITLIFVVIALIIRSRMLTFFFLSTSIMTLATVFSLGIIENYGDGTLMNSLYLMLAVVGPVSIILALIFQLS